MMNNKTIHINRETARIFIGLGVPANVREQIRGHLRDYTRFTKKLVPEENWHVTMAFIGELSGYKRCLKPLSEIMPQSFIPTLSLTHIGRGLQEEQLWAFAKTTTLLSELQKQLMDRLDSLNIGGEKKSGDLSFAPHINLGDLRLGSSNNLLADLPMPVVWRVEKLTIYRSELLHRGANYSVMGHIGLS